MAATLQDVSTKLMKPAKDLAEWTFPLAQVLEDYYTLLEQPCDLNFGEAALVLQNSANVYVRRVEYLYQETSALNQSITDHENDKKESSTTNQRKNGKTRIAFDNFELIDFSKEINKNCNLKPTKAEKKIKMLTQRYPQLENVTRNKYPLDILDTNGEIIGKKYDYRCNEQLSISGMLVDEVTPDDFADTQINNIPEILETDLEVVNAFDSCSEYGDTFRDAGVFSPTQESGYGSMISSSDAVTPSSRDLSDFSHTLNESVRDPKDLLMSPVDSSIECDKVPSPEPEQTQTNENVSENTISTEDKSNESTEINSNIDRTSRIRDSIETDAGYTSGDPDDIQQQTPSPPKRVRRVTRSSVINELNEEIWKPIPFDGGIPDKLPKSRSEFKLPCHISLLKYRRKSRKKKSENAVKRDKLKCYLLNENNETKSDNDGEGDRKKLLLYSPTKPMSSHMKEEIEGLQKIIEQCFKSKSPVDGYNYRAVENSNEDLLGFETTSNEYENDITTNSDNPRKFIENLRVVDDNCVSQLRLSLTTEASCSYTPPQSPTCSRHSDGEGLSDELTGESMRPAHNERTHQERIELKMNQLRRESDIRNDRQEETAKWYKTIEALKSVERRRIFHVRDYEKRIVDALEREESHRLDFDAVVMQHEPDDIARLFVASLQLANTYNIEINVARSHENTNVSLTLLNGDLKQHT